MAEKANRIMKLFQVGLNIYGFYIVKFYIDGKPTDIIIDDQFPCLASKRSPIFAKPNGREIWVMLLEKAWIKQFKFYSKASSISPDLII